VSIIFWTDENYEQITAGFGRRDGIFALCFFALCMILMSMTGWVLVSFGLLLNSFFGLATICLVFVMVRMRKQSIQTVGITRAKLLRSSVVGLVLSAPLVIFAVMPRIMAVDGHIQPAHVLYSVFFYLVVVSFGEEIVFRGYIQSRLHGLIKNSFFAVAIGGIMFSAMHIPFQSAVYYFQNGQRWPGWITPLQLLIWVGMHVVFNALHRKYNCLAAPTILHFFMNFTIIQPALFIS